MGENMIDEITSEEYRKKYRYCDTWGDLDKLNDRLTPEQMKDLMNSLEEVNNYTGLDMRQEHLLGCLKALKKQPCHEQFKSDKGRAAAILYGEFCVECGGCLRYPLPRGTNE